MAISVILEDSDGVKSLPILVFIKFYLPGSFLADENN
jgi:hypothetical protein